MSKPRIKPAQVLFLIVVILATGYSYLYDKYVVPVVMYHSINDKASPHLQNASTVNTEDFRFQMEYLKKNHYLVISLEEYLQGLKTNRVFFRKTVVIALMRSTRSRRRAQMLLPDHWYRAIRGSHRVCREQIGRAHV